MVVPFLSKVLLKYIYTRYIPVGYNTYKYIQLMHVIW